MCALLTLGIIFAVFTLFCLLPLGVAVTFGKPVAAQIRIGPIRFQVAPSRKKNAHADKPQKKNRESERGKKLLEDFKKSPKAALEILVSVFRSLAPPTKKALHRLLRDVRIDPLQIGVTLGGAGDPAGTAALYGRAEGAVWAVMPALEQLVRIPHPGIHIGIDFDSEKTEVQGEIGVSLRIGTLLAIGFGLGIPALRWFLSYQMQKKKKRKEQAAKVNSPVKYPAA